MVLQTMAGSAMNNMGMSPMGLSDQNLYDRLQSHRFTQMYDDMLKRTAQMDRDNYMRGFQGTAALFDTPWGPEQQKAAGRLSDAMVAATPLMIQIAPQLLDEMNGTRGSMPLMSHYMMQGGRMRVDPMTGRSGMGVEATAAMVDDVRKAMFDTPGASPRMPAGQMGLMFFELQRRGLVAGGTSLRDLEDNSPMTLARTAEELNIDLPFNMTRLSTQQKRMLQDKLGGVDINAASSTELMRASQESGINVPIDFNRMSSDMLNQLKNAPAVREEMASFDSSRVVDSMKKYQGAVKAMQEIFGDAGHPNAPMPELINALNRMSSGGLSQVDPGQLEMMVRTTANLAQTTKVGLPAAMMLQEYATDRAQALGLNPVFGAQAVQQGLAFTAAYQQLGLGGLPAWGLGDQQFQQQLAIDLSLNAAQSPAANMMGLAERMRQEFTQRDEAGNVIEPAFREGSDASRYLQAVRAGQTHFQNAKGESVSVNMDTEDFVGMIQAGSTTPLDESQIYSLLSQEQTNAEYKFEINAAGLTRRLQREEAIAEISEQMDTAAHGAVAERLRPDGEMNEQQQRRLAEQVSQLGGILSDSGSQALFSMDRKDVVDAKRRNASMVDAMRARLEQTAANQDDPAAASAQELLGRFADDPQGLDKFLTSVAADMYGTANEELAGTEYGSVQNIVVQHDKDMGDRAERVFAEQQVKGMYQTALSPLGKGSLVRRAVQAVMEADPDKDNNLQEIFGKIAGGVVDEDIAAELGGDDGLLQQLNDSQQEFEKRSQEYEAALTPEDKTTAFDRLKAQAVAMQTLTAQFREYAEKNEIDLNVPADAAPPQEPPVDREEQEPDGGLSSLLPGPVRSAFGLGDDDAGPRRRLPGPVQLGDDDTVTAGVNRTSVQRDTPDGQPGERTIALRADIMEVRIDESGRGTVTVDGTENDTQDRGTV